MPFGLDGAPASFCRLMSIVFEDHLRKICLSYLGDIIVFARTQEELLERLRIVLNRLRQVGIKVKPSKCALFQKEIDFLGHLVSATGVDPLPDKLTAIRDWPTPHCLGDVLAFYGLASYYRRFAEDFTTIAEPLTGLTKKNTPFPWSSEADHGFQRLKQALLDATTRAFPVTGLTCILDTDASCV